MAACQRRCRLYDDRGADPRAADVGRGAPCGAWVCPGRSDSPGASRAQELASGRGVRLAGQVAQPAARGGRAVRGDAAAGRSVRDRQPTDLASRTSRTPLRGVHAELAHSARAPGRGRPAATHDSRAAAARPRENASSAPGQSVPGDPRAGRRRIALDVRARPCPHVPPARTPPARPPDSETGCVRPPAVHGRGVAAPRRSGRRPGGRRRLSHEGRAMGGGHRPRARPGDDGGHRAAVHRS